MKVAIDTRHDTLEEALAVVALAFGSNGKGATSKPKRATKKATSGRKAPGRGAVLAEPEAASTVTEAASPSQANGSRRRAGAGKAAARKATVERTAAKNAPPKKSSTRKAAAHALRRSS